MRFFKFTKNEQLGLVGLLLIFFALFLVEYLSQDDISALPHDFVVTDSSSTQKVVGAKLEQKSTLNKNPRQRNLTVLNNSSVLKKQSVVRLKIDKVLFVNQMNVEDWQAIGLPNDIAERCFKYIWKLNGVRDLKELKNIYGLKDVWVKQIDSFADFSFRVIDLNMASIDELKILNGVGDVTARRIVKYRDLLAGFADVEQVADVYGLDSAVLNQRLITLIASEEGVTKLNPLKASYNVLSNHFFIKPTEAKEIIKLRSVNALDSVTVQTIIKNKKALKYFTWN